MTTVHKTLMTLEELRSTVGDVLAEASRSDAQMTQAVLLRVNDNAILDQLLTATLSVARTRHDERITELGQELELPSPNAISSRTSCSRYGTCLPDANAGVRHDKKPGNC